MKTVELHGCLGAQIQENEGGIKGNLDFQLGKLGKNDKIMWGKLQKQSGRTEVPDKFED